VNEHPDSRTRLWVAALALIVVLAWCRFPWAAFAAPLPVTP
jgi:hypothetical protein